MGNKPSPFVLRALCILGPDEILSLAHGLNQEEISLKRAAGDDLVFWRDKSAPARKKTADRSDSDAKVLPFNRLRPLIPEKITEEEGENHQIMSSEVILLQREISRESVLTNHKNTAKSGYSKASEMYIVKSSTVDGKEKIRFASTNGVLINKKQA